MKWQDKIENIMNVFSIKKKLFIIYVFYVILPLILTDSIILLKLPTPVGVLNLEKSIL